MADQLAITKRFNLKMLAALSANPEFEEKPLSISRMQWHLRIGYNMASHLLQEGIEAGILILNEKTPSAARFSKKPIKYRCSDCRSISDVSIAQHYDDMTYIECQCGERCDPFMTWDEYKEEVAKELHKQAKWPMPNCINYAETFDVTYKEVTDSNDMPCPADDVAEELTYS